MPTMTMGLSLTEWDGEKSIDHVVKRDRFASTVIKRETVSLTGSAFTALTAPSGAKHVIILPGTAVSLTLKGVTGDTGVALTPASSPTGAPISLPVSSPSIGIYNGGSTASVEVFWS